MYIFNPIVRKFFGEAFVHYPGHLMILPKLFYYARSVLYVFLGVFLSAVTVNIVRNITGGLPLKGRALVRNCMGRIWSLVSYGILIIVLAFLINRVHVLATFRFARFASVHLPQIIIKSIPIGMVFTLFVTNMLFYPLVILIIPIIVVKKVGILKALAENIFLGIRHYFSIFIMVFVPSLLYLPIILLKSFPTKVASRTCAEMIPLVIALGIIVELFIECFVVVCTSQFILDKNKGAIKAIKE